jgi:hypothetical protein
VVCGSWRLKKRGIWAKLGKNAKCNTVAQPKRQSDGLPAFGKLKAASSSRRGSC